MEASGGDLFQFAVQFRTSTLLITFFIILLGLLFGELRISGVGFGSSGVLIVALVAGYFFEIRSVPELSQLGIVLFLWAVGLEAGPYFFRSFRQSGKKYLLTVLFLLGAAGSGALAAIYATGYDAGLVLGLLGGVMTSTPAMVAATQVADHNLVMLGYSVAYPFGLLGVILFIQISLRILRRRMENENRRSERMFVAMYRLTARKYRDRLVRDIDLFPAHQVIIASVLRADNLMACGGRTLLLKDDVLRLEGEEAAVKTVGSALGEEVTESFRPDGELDTRMIAVENVDNVNRTLSELNLRMRYQINVTRVIRNGFEMYPEPGLRLIYGDIVAAVGTPYQLDRVEGFLGRKEHAVQPRVDIRSFALMMFLSFLVGGVALPVIFLGNVSLGMAGGALLVGLFFGHFGRVGSFIGRFPRQATRVMKEFGLAIFFAQLGVQAGAVIVDSLTFDAIYYVAVSLVMLLVPMIASLYFSHRIMKLSLSEAYGVICGGMTFTPGLEIVRAVDSSEKPVVAYSAVYPVALIGVILVVQIVHALA